MPLRVLDHPLAGHLLAQLRDLNTPPERFRHLTSLLTGLLVLEATRDIGSKEVKVETPIEQTTARMLHESLAVVPILRAGLGMLDAAVELFPDVAVGYIGLERHEETAVARSYYSKLPNLAGKYTLCLDPMLATGGSAAQAISLIKVHEPCRVVMVCVVAAPEGIAKLEEAHPDVLIVTAARDRGLNDKKYIVPGLGDFGDRLYGTF
ncbi:MAG TPA: uracil phosphoribosyltransferase [Fimbriimonadaceae bacterium]|nr:uracil phosphoribosyltransferase [Fimbriimonadaceae bacterium]